MMRQILDIDDLKKLKTDKCVLCGEDTGMRSSMPIELRSFYVEGCGQLCWTCWKGLYENLFTPLDYMV